MDNNNLTVEQVKNDFISAAKLAEKNGKIVIYENNEPKYMLVDIESSPIIEMTDDEKIDFVAARILKQHKKAFEELAK